ncbi:MAG: hypothetical protein CMJ68_24085 [Planctomycetaceae bacterium]|nr:hypothetical protein [Planctomycetaceae bacterium]
MHNGVCSVGQPENPTMTMNLPRLHHPVWTPSHRAVAGLACLAVAIWTSPLVAQQAEQPAGKAKKAVAKTKSTPEKIPRFIRIVRDEKTGEPLRMETATVRYVKRAGKVAGKRRKQLVTVDMIGAVHVGERAYYDALNKQFEQYDALLYELVADKGVRPPKGAKAASNNPAGFLQNAMKSTLKLDHQLELIDYSKKNFVHADLSPDEMAAAMKKRGDNALTITLGVLADMIRQQRVADAKARKKGARGQAEEVDIVTMLLDPNGPVKMKRMMAEQMADLGPGTGVGKTLDQLLIQDRNAAAMRVLQEQLKKGKRRLGVFYGAAHLPDFHRRMVAIGFRPKTVTWTSAWDLRIEKKTENDDLIQLLRLFQRLSQ